MSAALQIRELPKGLSIRITAPRHIGRILLTLAFGSACIYFFLHDSFSSKLLQIFVGGVFIISLIRDILSALRGVDVELRITNLDFISSGRASKDYRPSTISRADIYNLEFREVMDGGDFLDLPKGLYVEYHGGPSICVLPHLDKLQTKEVIEAIYRRFPDTGTLSPAGPLEPYLTSLNLNQSKGS